MKNLAPIVLFTYNRPHYAEQTLRALKNCKLSADSVLYIYSDGPKSNSSSEDRQRIKDTRRLIASEKWCGEVNIIEHESNLGLGKSIIDGVSRVLSEHGRIIVLEDDMLVSPGFLKYMNDALVKYEAEERVMHISSYWFPVKTELPDTFFLQMATCSGGWATWQRAWQKLKTDASLLYKSLKQLDLLTSFNLDGASDFAMQLNLNANGHLNTWAIKWYASIFLNNGLSLHPGASLVRNIGFDELGSNTGRRDSNYFRVENLKDFIEVKKIPLEVNSYALESYKRHRIGHIPPLLKPLYKNYTKSIIVRNTLNSLYLLKKKLKF